jgi:hypothetical protein
MPEPTTQLFSDLVRELKDSNRQLADAIHDLSHTLDRKIDLNHTALDRKIDLNQASLSGRLDGIENTLKIYVSLAKWGIGLLTALVVATAAGAFSTYREFGEVKQTVNRIASKIDAEQVKTFKPGGEKP